MTLPDFNVIRCLNVRTLSYITLVGDLPFVVEQQHQCSKRNRFGLHVAEQG